MLRISQINLNTDHTKVDLEHKICKTLGIRKEEMLDYQIQKQSVDARKKPLLFFSYTIDVKVSHEEKVIRRVGKKVQKVDVQKYCVPKVGEEPISFRPIVVGSGPAGMFCTYLLAENGYCPLLLERGGSVEERAAAVESFWENGVLDLDSNVQFGEGGAGTFSDGKLNTTVKDPLGRNRFVLELFVKHGAPESILYEQKPHIGTDILMHVVKSMREHICGMGGEVRFHSQVTDMSVNTSFTGGQQVKEITVNGEEVIQTNVLILAIGHSARDTFHMLYKKHIPMMAKSFAVGVRIEHPQEMIEYSQYGTTKASNLPAASYKLTAQLPNQRGVYTFCMCPGGYVVNASSEENRLAVNGMSYHKRDGQNANSAVIVTVTTKDYDSDHPLAGIEFQRRLEERAHQLGKGKVPVQCFEDFKANKITLKLGDITPQIKGNYTFANVRSIFPEALSQSLEDGIQVMDKKIPGVGRKDAILSGVESRTSSPVKIERNAVYESEVSGLYPCGEGAGYAGGITSAAMDGIKTAEAIIKRYMPSVSSKFTKN